MQKDTKTALLDLAESTVRARGFDGFSYADLAETIGIRKASIHYHFPSKANLSEALMDRYHITLKDTLSKIDAEHDIAAHRLSALIDVYRQASNGGQSLCLCVAFISSRESLSDALNTKIVTFRAMLIDWLTKTFALARQDRSVTPMAAPDHEAQATLALLEGAHLAARASEDAHIFDQALALLKSRL